MAEPLCAVCEQPITQRQLFSAERNPETGIWTAIHCACKMPGPWEKTYEMNPAKAKVIALK